jgi:uncharacterized protein (DUF2147 family)
MNLAIKKTFGLLTLLALMAIGTQAFAQSPIGVWKTIDDKTGQAKSHVEIYQKDGKIHAKVVKLLLKPNDTKCEKCSGARKNKPIVGMDIMWGLTKSSDYWKKGTIFDPESDTEYGCSIWFESGKTDELKVRGYHWSGIYRTQTWYRVK